ATIVAGIMYYVVSIKINLSSHRNSTYTNRSVRPGLRKAEIILIRLRANEAGLFGEARLQELIAEATELATNADTRQVDMEEIRAILLDFQKKSMPHDEVDQKFFMDDIQKIEAIISGALDRKPSVANAPTTGGPQLALPNELPALESEYAQLESESMNATTQ